MTANEAIKILEVAKAECEWNAPLDYQEAFDLAISALQAQDLQPICNELAKDTISRQAAIDAANDWLLDCLKIQKQDRSCGLIRRLEDLPSARPEPHYDEWCDDCKEYDKERHCCPRWNKVIRETLKDAQPEPKWIPCSERLPEESYPVIVTWKNDDPVSYYQYILGKHYVGVAHYKNGKWFWYSSITEDVLMEYGRCDSEEFDEAINVLAWMPLPEPYTERREE